MDENKEINKFLFLKFADSKLPEFKEERGEKYVRFGSDNAYPDYLLELYNKSAKHAAIINNKVNYIIGKGLMSLGRNAKFEGWIEKCNRANEGMDEIAVKSSKDCEVNGGFYWQIIPNAMGQISEIYHVNFKNIRTNLNRTKFYHKKNWKDASEDPTVFPRFVPGTKKPSIFSYREYRQDQGVYPLPNYISAINWIESDFQVSKHTLSNSKTGFSASKMVSLFNGTPSVEEQKEITRGFNEQFTGADGEKMIVSFNQDVTKKPVIEDLGASDLTKENFTQIDDLICANIYAGHQITSPMLFGIMESGKLGAGNELKFAYDIFKNTYVNFKQKQLEDVINFFAKLIYNVEGDLKLQDVDPIGFPLSDQIIMGAAPYAWQWEKMGIDPKDYPEELAALIAGRASGGSGHTPAGQSSPGNPGESMVNDNLKNLSGRQLQGVQRIIKKFTDGKITRQVATHLLKNGFGLSDEDVSVYLGDQFSVQFSEQAVADMFQFYGEDREGFQILKSKEAIFEGDEFSPSELFEVFEEEKGLGASIKALVKRIGGGGKVLPPQVSIKYSYEKRPEASGDKVKATTRPFCAKLCSLNRLYSRSEIQSISEAVGYSVWNRSGGFWTHGKNDPDPGYHDPKCRHEWRMHVVVKK